MTKSENRAEQGRFAPGKSGNPGGRPAVVKVIQEAAQKLGPQCIEGLWALATNTEQPGAIRRAAYSDILDRGFGKPVQPMLDQDEEGRALGRPLIMFNVVGKHG